MKIAIKIFITVLLMVGNGFVFVVIPKTLNAKSIIKFFTSAFYGLAIYFVIWVL